MKMNFQPQHADRFRAKKMFFTLALVLLSAALLSFTFWLKLSPAPSPRPVPGPAPESSRGQQTTSPAGEKTTSESADLPEENYATQIKQGEQSFGNRFQSFLSKNRHPLSAESVGRTSQSYRTFPLSAGFNLAYTIAPGEERNSWLSVSPDRRYIAMTRAYEFNATLEVNTLAGVPMMGHLEDSQPVEWSADGKELFAAYMDDGRSSSMSKIYRLNFENNEIADSGLPLNALKADLSPNGKTWIYAKTDGGITKSELWMKDVQTNRETLVSPGEDVAYFETVQWSRDGVHVITLAHRANGNEGWLLDASGHIVKKFLDIALEVPELSLDSHQLLYIKAENGSENLWEYDLAKRADKPLTNYSGVRISHPSYVPNGDIVFLLGNNSGAGEIYLYHGGKVKQVTADGTKKNSLVVIGD